LLPLLLPGHGKHTAKERGSKLSHSKNAVVAT